MATPWNRRFARHIYHYGLEEVLYWSSEPSLSGCFLSGILDGPMSRWKPGNDVDWIHSNPAINLARDGVTLRDVSSGVDEIRSPYGLLSRFLWNDGRTPSGRKSRGELFGYVTRGDFREETKRERETSCVRYNFHEFEPLVYEYNGVSLKFKWRNLVTVETSYDKIIRLNNRRWISCSKFDDNWQRSSFSNDTPRIYDVIL